MGKSSGLMGRVGRNRCGRRRLLLEPLEHRLLLDAGAAGPADDLFEVQQNADSQLLDVLGNDAFEPGYPGERRITSVSYGSEGGRIEIAEDGGSIWYAPPADFSGEETFVYYVDNQLRATATVRVLAPLAADEYRFPPDGQPRILRVLDNDSFWPDYGGPREITSTSETLLGSELELAADGGSLIYTPPTDAYGKDAFVYIVDDLYPAQVEIQVFNPIQSDRYPDLVQNSENKLLDVLANDPFWPGYPGNRVVTHVTGPDSGGTVTIAEDGRTLYYTPVPDFAGWDHFRYVVDSLYEASVSLQVHRPVRDDTYELDKNSVDYPLSVTDNDYFYFRSNDGVRIRRDVVDRVTAVGETAQGGTVEIMADGQGIVYSTPADFEGTDSFEYIADGEHRATVQVHVTRPVRDDRFNSGVYEDTVDNVLDVLHNDFRGNGYQGPKIITAVSDTTQGATVTIAAGGRWLRYTPPAGYRGGDTFSYTVDGELVAEVQVSVGAIAADNHYRLYPDPTQTVRVLSVLSNDHFGSNYPGPGLITAVGETANGGQVTISADGRSLQFVPPEGGSDSFTYTVDGKYQASVSVRFQNFLRNDSFVVDQNSPASEHDLLQNDFLSSNAGGYLGPRQITSVGPCEQGGTVTIATGTTVVYEPAPDLVGSDRFTYTVDGLMQQTVRVQVIRRVRDDLFRVETDSLENALPVLVNDLFGADYSGAGRVTAVTGTDAGGTATVGADGGSIDYTPPAGFTGEDKFTYTVDGALKAEVTVWVGASVEEMLPRFDSLEQFKQFLLDEALARYEHLFGTSYWGGPPTGGFPEDVVSPTFGDPSRTHSETNVQVAGVDEDDIIETDGDYLYVVTADELIIAQAWPAQEMAITSRVAIEGEPIGEYLHGDRLTVLSQTWEYPWWQPWDPWGGAPGQLGGWCPWPISSQTWVTVFDVSDRTSPAIVEQMKLDGTYLQSRRIDDSVFLVLRDYAVDHWLPRPEWIPQADDQFVYETREQYIERVTADMDNYLPHHTSYGADGELLQTGLLHASGGLFRPLGPDARNLVTVVSLNMSDDVPGIIASTGIFATGAGEIYGSLDHLYVFDQQYTWEDGVVTDILKFDWDAATGQVEFAAQGGVPGRMLDQFSADEFQEHLRIATTIDNGNSGNWSGRSENVLFALRDDGGVLEFVGSMQNLALGERIRSVRFLGERAFLTTFRDVDPLFALDLSDPADPQSRGHVTMPGYNSYMQLIDGRYLLAVGRNTPMAGTGPTQVSLFDVEDLSRPRVIDQYTFPRFSTSEAETEHHAFGWFAQHNLLAMPSARVYWERIDEDGDGYRETRRSVREDQLVLFAIDVTATRASGEGIQPLGELAHDSPVRRSAFIEDVLYSVAENSACAIGIPIPDPPVPVAEIRFEIEPGGDASGGWPQIIDDQDVGFHAQGHWVCDSGQGFADGIHLRRATYRGDVASWSFSVAPGLYRLAATWPEHLSGAGNAPFTVLDGSTPLATVRLDQGSPPDDFVEGQIAWEDLGVFQVTGDRLVVVLSDDAEDYVIADAIRVEPVSPIAGRHVFYNHSTFDGNDPTANELDNLAIALDKQALLPGQTATFANYTSYSQGINGLMVDVFSLPGGSELGAQDFRFRLGNNNHPESWADAPNPASITVRRGAGIDGSDRVVITWSDHVIRNQWLQVTVLATPRTGLRQTDVFYFGNAIGESGNSAGDAKVNASDMLGARDNRRNFLNPAPIDFLFDFNRDQRVNAADMLIARNNATHFLNALRLITVPSGKGNPQDTAALRRGSAHDTVLRYAFGNSGRRSAPLSKLDWLYEYESLTSGRQDSAPRGPSGATLDKLLAVD